MKKSIKSVQTDAFTFTISETDLEEKNINNNFYTPTRNFHSLKWFVSIYPAGRSFPPNRLFLYLFQKTLAVKANMTLAVKGHPKQWVPTENIDGHRLLILVPHDEIRPLFKDGKLTLICSAEFVVQSSYLQHPNFENFDKNSIDFEILVKSNRLPVHKAMLSSLSPVFNAMLSHDTMELQKSEIKISDFDFKTVKAAIDYCYGRRIKNPSVKFVIDILRFGDKYDITLILTKLGSILALNLSLVNFDTVFLYAYEHSNIELHASCFEFYKNNQKRIHATGKFDKIPLEIFVESVKRVFKLETKFDVLRYAIGDIGLDLGTANELSESGLRLPYYFDENKRGMLVKLLEEFLLEELTLEHFCPTVQYALDFDREELMKTCAEFWNANRDEILELEAYYELSPSTTHTLSYWGYRLKHNLKVSW